MTGTKRQLLADASLALYRLGEDLQPELDNEMSEALWLWSVSHATDDDLVKTVLDQAHGYVRHNDYPECGRGVETMDETKRQSLLDASLALYRLGADLQDEVGEMSEAWWAMSVSQASGDELEALVLDQTHSYVRHNDYPEG